MGCGSSKDITQSVSHSARIGTITTEANEKKKKENHINRTSHKTPKERKNNKTKKENHEYINGHTNQERTDVQKNGNNKLQQDIQLHERNQEQNESGDENQVKKIEKQNSESELEMERLLNKTEYENQHIQSENEMDKRHRKREQVNQQKKSGIEHRQSEREKESAIENQDSESKSKMETQQSESELENQQSKREKESELENKQNENEMENQNNKREIENPHNESGIKNQHSETENESKLEQQQSEYEKINKNNKREIENLHNESGIKNQYSETENNSEPEQQQSECEKENKNNKRQIGNLCNESGTKNQHSETENESQLKQQQSDSEKENKNNKREIENLHNESGIKNQNSETKNESELEQQQSECETENKIKYQQSLDDIEHQQKVEENDHQHSESEDEDHKSTLGHKPRTSEVNNQQHNGKTEKGQYESQSKKGDNESPYKQIDNHARKAPASLKNSADDLINYLSSVSKEPRILVRGIFVWISENINYDVEENFGRAKRAPHDSEGVMKWGRSVCEGYANVMQDLCRKANIPVQKISGFAKNYSHSADKIISESTETDHAWNAVQLGGKWYLIDSTWGAGHVNQSNTFEKEFDEFYFLTNPKHMITDHFPYMNGDMEESKKWQLLDKPVSLPDFSRAVKYGTSAFLIGARAVSHRNGFVEMKNELKMIFKSEGPDDIVFSARLELRDGNVLREQRNATYGYLENGVFTLLVHPPKVGTYTMDVFGYPVSEESKNTQYLMSYLIKCTDVQDNEFIYPQTFATHNTERVILRQPMSGKLTANTAVRFKIEAPFLQTIMVGDYTMYLEKSGTTFSGTVMTGTVGQLNLYGSRDDGGMIGFLQFTVI